MQLTIAALCLVVNTATAFRSTPLPLFVQPIHAKASAGTLVLKDAAHAPLRPRVVRGTGAHLAKMGIRNELPPEGILNAVQDLGGRVTISDVASKSGTSIMEAKEHLTAMARQVGDLEVSSHGDLVYVFPKTFRTGLVASSRQRRVQQKFRSLRPRLQHLLKVTFGVSLFASVALIWVSIFMLMRSRDDGSGYSGPGSVGLGWIFPHDPLFWVAYDASAPTRPRMKPDMSFLEAVFSFVFGDGDPNWNLEERRRIAVAQLVRKQHGVLLPEQVAPFLDLPRGALLGKMEEGDRRQLLSLLLDLGGRPEVTESGEVVYVFEELQTSASVDRIMQKPWPKLVARAVKQGLSLRKITAGKGALAMALAEQEAAEELRASAGAGLYLREEEQVFSKVSFMQMVGVWLLAYVNWAGGLFLEGLLRQAEAKGQALVGWLLFTQSIYPFLVGFGLSLMVIPMVRGVLMNARNGRIRARNAARARVAELNAINQEELRARLLEAREFRRSLRVVPASDVEYTSGESIAQQRLDLKRFDERHGLSSAV